MLILSINKILNWCQISAGGRSYTCPTKEINGELFFHFKKVWHPVSKYLFESSTELVEEGGKIISRIIKK